MFCLATLCRYLLTVYAWKSVIVMLIVFGITLNGVVIAITFLVVVPLRPPVHYWTPCTYDQKSLWTDGVKRQQKHYIWTSRSQWMQRRPTIQESCAIAKMTAQCALHYGCPEIFRDSLTTSTATVPNIFRGFCSGRPYECSYKIWSP